MLFNKAQKKKIFPIHYLLDEAKTNAISKGDNCFYYILNTENERHYAEDWCKNNNINFSISHKIDNNTYYKFTFNT